MNTSTSLPGKANPGLPAPFANYLQLPTVLPMRVWLVLRYVSVAVAIAMAVLLVVTPEIGLPLFWSVIVPLLPMVFVLAPGLWRNLCPMAAMNQAPRLLGLTRGWTHSPTVQEYSYVIGIALFFILVSSRKWLFDGSGVATAALILFGLISAFFGGLLFKGKSGWCSSICPMLPVQRVYGQTPIKRVANAHCRPCVGCTKNCFDFNPGVAYLADQYDSDIHYVGYRRFFVGVLPGFILAFFSIAPASDVATIYGTFALFGGISLAILHGMEIFLKVKNNRITVLFGATAFTLYYWFSSVTWFSGLSALTGHWAVPSLAPWLVRLAVSGFALHWIWRSFNVEDLFVAQTVQRTSAQPVKLGEHAAAALKAAGQSAKASLTIEPDMKTYPAQTGKSLLELVEGCGEKIEAGCRMGVCGADPIAVREGSEFLTPASDDELQTLARLGHAQNTRMACSARLHSGGCVRIALTPDKATAPVGADVKEYDTDIQRIVIVGNGIAGVTAADHIRRNHPACNIQIVAQENHPLYNRMGITRLVYGRSAMQGLHLMADHWYSDRNIEVLLNTAAKAIDTEHKTVVLAEGAPLPYDRLILATGSSSFVPPMEGWGAPGCFVMRSADDAMDIRTYAQRHGARNAVIAGGGLLGLEAAYALHKLGLEVAVVERNSWILNRQLDERGGNILQGYLQSLGIRMHLGAHIARLAASGTGATHLHLAQGDPIPAEIVIVAAGIAPNTDLAKAAGLQVGRGVVVNEHMATSVPAVFAAGDVAECDGRVMGLWPIAVEQAEIAAKNALGVPAVYREPVLSTVLKVVGADLISVGEYNAKDGDVVIAEENLAEYRYRKLLVREGKLVGAILIGWPALMEPVSRAVKAHQGIETRLEQLRSGDWSVFQ